MVAAFTARGIPKHTLMNAYLMREIPLILEEWRRDEARADLRLLRIRAIPRITDERDRERAFDELHEEAFGPRAWRDDSAAFDRDGVEALKAALAGG